MSNDAAPFNAFYEKKIDPWGVQRLPARDRALRRIAAKYCTGKTVLELGCGEGHQTQIIAQRAKNVIGVDISSVAIKRAADRKINNASFVVAGMLDVSFEGYDVITAMECVYYLTEEQRAEFFFKISAEHHGVIVFSAPIVGGKYFTDCRVRSAFLRNSIALLETAKHEVKEDFRPVLVRRIFNRLAGTVFGTWALWAFPDRFIQRKLYIGRTFGL